MQSVSGKGLAFITVLVALASGVLLWWLTQSSVLQPSGMDDGVSSPSSSEPVASASTAVKSVAVVSASQAGSSESGVSARASASSSSSSGKKSAEDSEREKMIAKRFAEANKNISHLYSLVGDKARRAEAFAYAKKLSKGIAPERWAAIDAYGMLGGNAAVNALLPLMREDEMLADRVSEVLRHLIEESLYTQNPIMDNDAWLEVIELAGNQMGKNSYLTLLSSFSEIESVPVLMEMYHSENDLDRKLASDYMSFISGGKLFSDSKDAASWWQNWMDKRNITAADLKKYNDAKKAAGELLGISNGTVAKPGGADPQQPPQAPQGK